MNFWQWLDRNTEEVFILSLFVVLPVLIGVGFWSLEVIKVLAAR